MDAIFGATGTERNPIIMKYTMDIALAYLYMVAQPESIPESRIAAHEMAEKWLTNVAKQLVNPPDLPLPAAPNEGSKDYVVFGGTSPGGTN